MRKPIFQECAAQADIREFNRTISRASEEIMNTLLKSEQLILDCRKIITEADAVLGKDRQIWNRRQTIEREG